MNEEFVERLHTSLGKKYKVWVDVEGILVAEEWLEAIFKAIDASRTVICVLTKESVKSDICSKEIEWAFSNKKNLIPIVIGTRNSVEEIKKSCNESWKKTYVKVNALNYVFFNDDIDNSIAFGKVCSVIDIDPTNTRYQAELLVAARKWESNSSDQSLLFTGNQLLIAENWLQTNPNISTKLHIDFVKTSRKTENRLKRNQRIRILILISIIIIAIVVGSNAVATAQLQNVIASIQKDHNLGSYFYGIEDFKNAVKYYNSALTTLSSHSELLVNPSFTNLNIDLPSWYNELALSCAQIEDYSCAVENTSIAMLNTKNDNDVFAHLNRALFYVELQTDLRKTANLGLNHALILDVPSWNEKIFTFLADWDLYRALQIDPSSEVLVDRIQMRRFFQQEEWENVIGIYNKSETLKTFINTFSEQQYPKELSGYVLDILYFLAASNQELDQNSCKWWKEYQRVNIIYPPIVLMLHDNDRGIDAGKRIEKAKCS